MPETGIFLKDYFLPVIVLLELFCSIAGSIFIVMSVVAGANSKNSRCKNRAEILGWQLKALKYTKTWTLLLTISSFLGIIIGFVAGQKALIYINFFMAVLFGMFFLGIKRAHELVSKELDSVRAILDS